MNTTPFQVSACSIAGSDSSGGAGIQADLHSFADFGVHGCTAITALTAQNSTGIQQITRTPLAQLQAELRAVFTDFQPAAIKLGMLVDIETIECVAQALHAHTAVVVCDPVMLATTGERLLDRTALAALIDLLPQVSLITPNTHEATLLTGLPINGTADVPRAARRLLQMGAGAVLVTGGHLLAEGEFCDDFYLAAEQQFWLRSPRQATANSHGSGCTLTAAITAALARGYAMEDALVLAKMYLNKGLAQARRYGRGPGPVAHTGWPCELQYLPRLYRDLAGPEPVLTPEFPRCDSGPLGLYPLVASVDNLPRLLAAGVKTVQLRIKTGTELDLRASIQQAVELQRRHAAQLFINDYWALAIEYGAYGVHLGQQDLQSADLDAIAAAGLRLGVSNHAWYEIARAHAIAPSYMALGPVFATTTKQMPFAPLGVEQLAEWVRLLQPNYLTTAIGGIDGDNAAAVAATGVGSIAVVRALSEAAQPEVAVRHLRAVLADQSQKNLA